MKEGVEVQPNDHHRKQEFSETSPFTLPGFFQALKNEILYAAVCDECNTRLLPPRPACYGCGSRSLSLEEQPTTGVIVSYTAVHRPPAGFDSLAPYPIAIVELDSSARVLGRVESSYDALSIDQRVELEVRTPEITAINSLAYETDWPIHVFVPEE